MWISTYLPRTTPALTAGAVLLLAAYLRMTRLGELPAGFFCDEAGLGYNAYSILRTGSDETGEPWPLFVWSFGVSYKNPIFIYSAVVPIALLGLNETAVRITSAAYGLATVGAVYLLGRVLRGHRFGLIAALFLAVCPWHLHFSRIGFELITFPFFFVMGFYFFALWTRGEKTLPGAMFFFAACFYTYAVAKLFVPLFLTGLALAYRRELVQRRAQTTAAFGLLVLAATPVIVFDLSDRHRATRYFLENTLLGSSESLLVLLRDYSGSYAEFFSPRFLFREGEGLIKRHAVAGHGELYWLFAPLLLIGLAATVLRGDRAHMLLLWWLFAYPVGPALMTEIPSASRGIIGSVAFCLVAALGADELLRIVPRRAGHLARPPVLRALLAIAGGLLLALQVLHYWQLYRTEYATYSAKYYSGFQYGHREVVQYFLAHRDAYDRLVLSTTLNNQPQIFLLFYSAFSPERFQKEGLAAVERDTRMSVADPSDRSIYRDGERLLLAVPDTEQAIFASYELKHTIFAPDGTPAFHLIEPHGLKDFVRSWYVAGPYSGEELPVPPLAADNQLQPPHAAREWKPLYSPRLEVALGDVLQLSSEPSCAWTANVLHSDADRTARVFLSIEETGELWLNGVPTNLSVYRAPERFVADAVSGTVSLRRGANAIALWICTEGYGWRFYFRITDESGRPLAGTRWEDVAFNKPERPRWPDRHDATTKYAQRPGTPQPRT